MESIGGFNILGNLNERYKHYGGQRTTWYKVERKQCSPVYHMFSIRQPAFTMTSSACTESQRMDGSLSLTRGGTNKWNSSG